MRIWAMVGLALAMVACGGSEGGGDQAPASPSTTTAAPLRGAVIIKLNPILGSGIRPSGSTCDGAIKTGGTRPLLIFSDVEYLVAGAPIEVADESGKTVGTGTLDGGTWDRSGESCRLPFSVSVAPAKFYKVRVGGRLDRTFPAGTDAEFTVQG